MSPSKQNMTSNVQLKYNVDVVDVQEEEVRERLPLGLGEGGEEMKGFNSELGKITFLKN